MLTESSFRDSDGSTVPLKTAFSSKGTVTPSTARKSEYTQRVLAELSVAPSVDERCRVDPTGGGVEVQRHVEAAALDADALDGNAIDRCGAERRHLRSRLAPGAQQRQDLPAEIELHGRDRLRDDR